MTVVASDVCAIVAMCICLDHELQTPNLHVCMCAHAQSGCVYLVSTLDVIHVIKSTRLFPSLVGRAWEQGYKCVLSSEYAYIFMGKEMII